MICSNINKFNPFLLQSFHSMEIAASQNLTYQGLLEPFAQIKIVSMDSLERIRVSD